MPQLPVCGLLVGPGCREYVRFTKNAADKGQVGRVGFFIETMGHENTRLAGEIGDGCVQSGHGFGVFRSQSTAVGSDKLPPASRQVRVP
jgi:hypothetical protein